MSRSPRAGRALDRELSASGLRASSRLGSFPLRADYFRSLPLSRRARGELLAEARQNARASLRLAFSGQWRHVPPGRDGAQVRKDTSDLAESRRLVRAAAVLRCQPHELARVLANTSSESWRELARRCGGQRLVDALVLHAVRSPSSSQAPGPGSDAEDEPGGRASHWEGGSTSSPTSSHSSEPERPLVGVERRSSEASAAADMRVRAHHNRWAASCRRRAASSAAAAVSGQAQGASSASMARDPDGLGETADELLTVKWAAFDAGAGGRRDLCLVDYLSTALLPLDDDDDAASGDADAAEGRDAGRERVHVWSVASTDGARVGCGPLQSSHRVRRASLARLGVLWRRHAEGEAEVVVCGSFRSAQAPAATAALLAALSRLQRAVEDLRLGGQAFLPRRAWVDDRDRASCRLCLRGFFALRRRHHCRRCGEVVCADCSAVERVDRPGIGAAKLRMCKLCGLRARATPLRLGGSRENLFGRLERVREGASDSASASDYSSSGDYSGGDYCGGGDVGASPSAAAAPAPADDNQRSDDERSDAGDSTAVHPLLRAPEPPSPSASPPLPSSAGGDMSALLCELACQTLRCPIASVSVVDARGRSVRSSAGLDGRPELDRELRVFLERVMGPAPAVVLDANVDAQARLAFPAAPPALRFFAGCPIYSRAGRKLGHVCVADLTKRDAIGASGAFAMERLATLAVSTMERRAAQAPSNQAVDGGERGTSGANEDSAKSQEEAPDVELVDAELLYDLTEEEGAQAANSAGDPCAKAGESVTDTQERMRRLLVQSYLTQQQLAAGSSPTATPF